MNTVGELFRVVEASSTVGVSVRAVTSLGGRFFVQPLCGQGIVDVGPTDQNLDTQPNSPTFLRVGDGCDEERRRRKTRKIRTGLDFQRRAAACVCVHVNQKRFRQPHMDTQIVRGIVTVRYTSIFFSSTTLYPALRKDKTTNRINQSTSISDGTFGSFSLPAFPGSGVSVRDFGVSVPLDVSTFGLGLGLLKMGIAK